MAESIRSRIQTKSQFTSSRWLRPRSAFRTETYCTSARCSTCATSGCIRTSRSVSLCISIRSLRRSSLRSSGFGGIADTATAIGPLSQM